ncbi:MAG: hypothetical protein KC400_05565, partial [Methanolinea sp.]|nr:hypothetical protein [Methanolinea sp.]
KKIDEIVIDRVFLGICAGLREKEVSPVTGRRQNYIRQCHEDVSIDFRNMHHSPGRHTISNTPDMSWTMAHETIVADPRL